MWIKNKDNSWRQVTKKSVRYSSPSVIKKKREAFERKKNTKAFRVWRWKTYNEQGRKCYYCHRPIVGAIHVDHSIPLARSGTSAYSNLRVCCRDCNLKKNIRFLKE